MRRFESFGLIVLQRCEDITKVLLVERRDSFAYLTYSKKKHKLNASEQEQLLSRMCVDEVESLAPGKNLGFPHREFGFPKGRKKKNENDLDCAIRECFQETGYSPNDYRIISHNYRYSENFIGTDGNMYTCKYFVVELVSDRQPVLQNSEISSADFFTVEEALGRIRHYDIQKQAIIKDIYKVLKVGGLISA